MPLDGVGPVYWASQATWFSVLSLAEPIPSFPKILQHSLFYTACCKHSATWDQVLRLDLFHPSLSRLLCVPWDIALRQPLAERALQSEHNASPPCRNMPVTAPLFTWLEVLPSLE